MSTNMGLDMAQRLIYKDNQIMAFDKPAGLAVQSLQKPDLHQLANAYAKRPLHLLHRIDQPVSGVVLFTRNAKAAAHLQTQFASGEVVRTYYAIVRNAPEMKDGELNHALLKMSKQNKSLVVNPGHTGARMCQLTYRWIASSDTYHLLRLQLATGRHHQIRAQLGAIDCSVKGDVKYGDRRANKDRSIHLHAHSLRCKHPVSGETIRIIAAAPQDVLWDFFREKMA